MSEFEKKLSKTLRDIGLRAFELSPEFLVAEIEIRYGELSEKERKAALSFAQKIEDAISDESNKKLSLIEKADVAWAALDADDDTKEYAAYIDAVRVKDRPLSFWRGLVHLLRFDPSRMPHRELLGTILMIMVILAFLGLRVVRFDFFPPNVEDFSGLVDFFEQASASYTWRWSLWRVVWFIETSIFVAYILAYLTRENAKSVARGFMEVVYPFVIAGLPIIIGFTEHNYLTRMFDHHFEGGSMMVTVFGLTFSELYFQWFVLGLFLFGGLLNLVGLLWLRRAFTIMSEARALIRTGPFSFVRHPLYTGHFIMFFGSVLSRFHWYTVALYVLFVVGQIYRAKIEERKLASVFPEYDEYRSHTGMFFPKLF